VPDKKYEFTDEQAGAIGELVVDRWGDNFQTGFEVGIDGNPVLWSKRNPDAPARRAVIAPDGTVTFDG
jgi:hypothetical protein